MSFNSFKCPNCGANLTINKIEKTGRCDYCGHEVIYDIPDNELARLVESADAHLRLKDTKILKKDCSLLYEKYPGKPITYYYLAKADLLEIAHLINNKENTPRCNYLLSCVYENLSRLREFNKDDNIDAANIINEYNNSVIINNKDMSNLIMKIKINNALYIALLVILIFIIISLCFTSLLFLGIVLIFLSFFTKLPKRILRNIKTLPLNRKNPKFE